VPTTQSLYLGHGPQLSGLRAGEAADESFDFLAVAKRISLAAAASPLATTCPKTSIPNLHSRVRKTGANQPHPPLVLVWLRHLELRLPHCSSVALGLSPQSTSPTPYSVHPLPSTLDGAAVRQRHFAFVPINVLSHESFGDLLVTRLQVGEISTPIFLSKYS
jgi:hypothetical protein